MKSVPQGLKATPFARFNVRAKARTYPTATFSAACKAQIFDGPVRPD
jgi:hypothetical protein